MKKLFFKHDIGARHDFKMQNLLMQLGAEGIGVYWCLVEILYENGGFLPKGQYKSIAFAMHVKEEVVTSVLQSDLFCYSEEEDSYYSERVLSELGSMKDLSEKRKASVLKRWNKYNSITNVIQSYTDKDKDKDKDKEENIIKEESKDKSLPPLSLDFDFPVEPQMADKKAKRFVKPSLQDVESYCKERGNGVNPEAFVNFYESKGWRVGNQPMRDWKAAVRTWEQKDNRYGNSSKNRTTFEERNYVCKVFDESESTI